MKMEHDNMKGEQTDLGAEDNWGVKITEISSRLFKDSRHIGQQVSLIKSNGAGHIPFINSREGGPKKRDLGIHAMPSKNTSFQTRPSSFTSTGATLPSLNLLAKSIKRNSFEGPRLSGINSFSRVGAGPRRPSIHTSGLTRRLSYHSSQARRISMEESYSSQSTSPTTAYPSPVSASFAAAPYPSFSPVNSPRKGSFSIKFDSLSIRSRPCSSPMSPASRSRTGSLSGGSTNAASPRVSRDFGNLQVLPARVSQVELVSGNDEWLLAGQTKRTEQLMKKAFQEIHDTCTQLNLGQRIYDGSKQIYWAAKSQNLCRGKPNEALSGASVYFTCRQEDEPRTFHEIASASTSNKRDIGRCYKILEKFLKTKTLSKMTIKDMIGRICSQLTFENFHDMNWIKEKACSTSEAAEELNLVASKSPLSVAAASVFMIIVITNPGRIRIAKDMAKICGVSEVTLRNVYREFYIHRHSLVNMCEEISNDDIENMPSFTSSSG